MSSSHHLSFFPFPALFGVLSLFLSLSFSFSHHDQQTERVSTTVFPIYHTCIHTYNHLCMYVCSSIDSQRQQRKEQWSEIRWNEGAGDVEPETGKGPYGTIGKLTR